MKKKTRYITILVCFGALVLRLLLASTPALEIDLNVWKSWGQRMTEFGPSNFYSDTAWTNHLPGFLYFLWFTKNTWLFLQKTFLLLPETEELVFKIPAILSDLLVGILILSILRKLNLKKALFALFLYLFNPAVIFNSSIWGQYDGYLTLLLLGSFVLLQNHRLVVGSFIYAFSLLTKPQAIALLPILLVKLNTFKKSFIVLSIFLLSLFLISLPFFQNPLLELPKILLKMSKDYPYGSLNAFNFWYLFANWHSDKITFLGVSYQTVGFLLFLFFETLIFLPFFLKRKGGNLYLATSLTFFNFFLFLTRIHERYLLPSFSFFLLAVFTENSSFLLILYLLLSIIHSANLFYVYGLYQGQVTSFFYSLIQSNTLLLSKITILIFILILLYYLKRAKITFGPMEKFKKEIMKISFVKLPLWLVLILCFAFLSRIFLLQHPQTHIFDEVYHAFTAQEMYQGNLAAWEWWNTPPKGFAYEWTHPPMAKLLMMAGIALFGSNSFGWRIPGAVFGTGVVFLIYLLGKNLFNKRVGLLAALLASFEGLLFVMSRIGMSDIYFLFFALAALLSRLKDKTFLSGLFFGFSLATKWTALYLLPLLFLATLLKERFGLKLLRKIILEGFLFLGLGAFIYLLFYLPFLKTHTFQKFIELQKQMWWYHTQLEATHDYQSKAYSWPLMLRPVWFYVKYGEKSIANIYALGNPLILWGGLAILPYTLVTALLKKQKKLLFTLLAYFIFWVSWVFSPRIMFFYHYLPSIPFLCLILAWQLEKWLKGKKKGKFLVKIYLVVVILSFCFFYPHLTGLLIPKSLDHFYYWLPSWK